MGRLIPIFEDRSGARIFDGRWRDEETGREGYLIVNGPADPHAQWITAPVFLSEPNGG